MRVQPCGSKMKTKRFTGSARWISCFTAIFVVALGVFVGMKATRAQNSPLPSTSTGQLGISPEEPVAPPQPIVVKTPAPSSNAPADTQRRRSRADETGQPGEAATPMPALTIPDPDPNNPVAVQSASLLKLAYSLKSEVDKTTKDTLSVTVVRQAAEIEQLARKMRTK